MGFSVARRTNEDLPRDAGGDEPVDLFLRAGRAPFSVQHPRIRLRLEQAVDHDTGIGPELHRIGCENNHAA